MRDIRSNKKINIHKSNPASIGSFKQRTNATLILDLYDEFSNYVDLTNQEVSIRIERPDGITFEQINNITKKSNVLTIRLKNEVFEAEGKCRVELNLKDSDGQMSSADFYFEVVKTVLNDNIVFGSDSYESLEKALTIFRNESNALMKKLDDSEKVRISNENTRKTQETSRANAENTRASNENTRISQENSRKSQENSRKDAENGRVNAEGIRVTSEKNRISEENTRKSNENTRISQENSRKTNEIDRQARFNNIESEGKELIGEMNTAIDGSKIREIEQKSSENTNRIEQLEDLTPVWQEHSGLGNITINDSFDGVTRDLIIKGRTLQNLSNPKTYGVTQGQRIYFTIINKSIFKATSYTIFNNSNKVIIYDVGNGDSYHKSHTLPPNSKKVVELLEGQNFRAIIGVMDQGWQNSEEDRDYLSKNCIILEGGYSNKQLPFNSYFEQITSSGEQEDNKTILKSTGKNLYSNKFLRSYESTVALKPTGLVVSGKWYTAMECPIFDISKNYIYSAKHTVINGDFKGRVIVYDLTTSRQVSSNFAIGGKIVLMDTYNPNNNNQLLFYVGAGDSESTIEFIDIQIEENTIATECEPYRECIKEVRLPFGGGLKCLDNNVDIVDLSKNKVYKNIECKEIDNTEVWSPFTNGVSSEILSYYIRNPEAKYGGKIISNLFVVGSANELKTKQCCYLGDPGIFISVKKSNLQTQDLNGFKKYLLDNNVKFLYELREPIIYNLHEDYNISTFNHTTHIYQQNNICSEMSLEVAKDRNALILSNTQEIKKANEKLEKTFDYLGGKIPVYVPYENEVNFIVKDSMEGEIRDVQIQGKTLLNIYNPNYATGESLLGDRFRKLRTKTSTGWYGVGIQVTGERDYWLPYYKPNTTYTIVTEVAENTLTGTGELFRINENQPQRIFNATIKLPNGFTGIHVAKVRTKVSFDGITHGLYPCTTSYWTNIDRGTIKLRHMVFEGDLTNYPTEYFEGLLSVGENKTEWYQGTIDSVSGLDAEHDKRVKTNFKRVLGDTVYFKNITPFDYLVFLYDRNKKMVNKTPSWISLKVDNAFYELPNNAYYYRIVLRKNDTDNIYPYEAVNVKVYTENENTVRLKSVGKNLLDMWNFRNNATQGVNTSDLKLKVKPNTYYTCSSNIPKTDTSTVYFNGGSTGTNGVYINEPKTFTSDNEGNLKLYIRTNSESGYTLSDFENGRFYVQLEEGRIATGSELYHEDTKFIKLSFDDGLKATPKIKDSYNEKNNIITENCGKLILDGSKGTITLAKTGVNTLTFNTTGLVDALQSWSDSDMLICDKFKSDLGVNFYNPDKEGCAIDSSGRIVIQILKSKLATQDINGFKEWLSKNPVTLIYGRKHPLIHNILDRYNLKSYDRTTNIQQDNIIKTNMEMLVPVSLNKSIGRVSEENRQLKEKNLKLTNMIEENSEYFETQDLLLTQSDLDLDFRLMEIEFVVGTQLTSSRNTKDSVARTPYILMKTLIIGETYNKEDLVYKISIYLERGRINQEEAAELIEMME